MQTQQRYIQPVTMNNIPYSNPQYMNNLPCPQPQFPQYSPYLPYSDQQYSDQLYINTQKYQQPQIIYSKNWDSGIFSCCEDFNICFNTILCCPCQTFTTKHDLDNGKKNCNDFLCQICLCPCTYMGLWCCQGAFELSNRRRFIHRLNFEEELCDVLKTICCLPCVVCQHRREVKFRKETKQIN